MRAIVLAAIDRFDEELHVVFKDCVGCIVVVHAGGDVAVVCVLALASG